jgi:hypothetical protein
MPHERERQRRGDVGVGYEGTVGAGLAVPGKAAATDRLPAAHPDEVARRTASAAAAAVGRLEALVPALRRAIAAADYAESGRLAFELRWGLKRLEADAARLDETDRARLARVAAAAAPLIEAAPVLEASDAGSAAAEQAWLVAPKRAVKLPDTAVGQYAALTPIELTNHGTAATQTLIVRAADADTEAVFPVPAPVVAPVAPSAAATVLVGFAPIATRMQRGTLDLVGTDGSIAATVKVRGRGISLERAMHVAIDRGQTIAVEGYADLVAALQLAAKLAEDADPAERAKATALAAAVNARFDAIEERIHDASRTYGVAGTTLLTAWGHGSSTVKTYWRCLAADLRPRTGDYVVRAVEAIEEIIKVGTGEAERARTIDALDNLEITLLATIGPIAAIAGIAAAPAVMTWALMYPTSALAVIETSVALGPQILAAGGIIAFLETAVSDPATAADTIATLIAGYGDYHATRPGRGPAASHPDAELAPAPRSRAPSTRDAEVSSTPARTVATVPEQSAAADVGSAAAAPTARASGRVDQPISGLFEAVDPAASIADWPLAILSASSSTAPVSSRPESRLQMVRPAFSSAPTTPVPSSSSCATPSSKTCPPGSTAAASHSSPARARPR